MHGHVAKRQTMSMLIWQLERGSSGYRFGNHNNQWVLRLWKVKCSRSHGRSSVSGHSCGSGDGPGHTKPCLCLKTLVTWGQLLSFGMDVGSKAFLTRANSSLLFQHELLSLCLEVKVTDSEARIPVSGLKCISCVNLDRLQSLSVPITTYRHSNNNTSRCLPRKVAVRMKCVHTHNR